MDNDATIDMAARFEIVELEAQLEDARAKIMAAYRAHQMAMLRGATLESEMAMLRRIVNNHDAASGN